MNFLVVGAIRNSEKTIFETIRCIDKGLNFAERIEYFFVESDSDDKTLESLEKLSKKKKNFNYQSYGDLRIKKPLRTERLAICRNRYLDYLNNKKNNWVQYLIVVDVDGVCSYLNSNILKSIIKLNFWDVITANVRGRYYDIWALRHKTWCPNDYMFEYKEYLIQGYNIPKAYAKSVNPKRLNLKSNSELIEVDSAFGGFGIYKRSSIPKDAKYEGLYENGQQVCEHISFHYSIKNNEGRIFINPKLIIGPKILPFFIMKIYNAIVKFINFWNIFPKIKYKTIN